MKPKKTIIFAGIVILSVFLFMNIPVDYLACSIIPMACNFFDVVDDDNQLNDSIEVNNINIELEVAFP